MEIHREKDYTMRSVVGVFVVAIGVSIVAGLWIATWVHDLMHGPGWPF